MSVSPSVVGLCPCRTSLVQCDAIGWSHHEDFPDEAHPAGGNEDPLNGRSVRFDY